MPYPERIIVGYDGSEPAALAVRWAARLAVQLDDELEVVHCSIWPLLTNDLGPVKGVAGSGLRQQARTVLEQGRAEAASVAPGINIRSSLLYGLPASHLRPISDGARMLVLGSRGIGGFMGLLVGSVSLELAATAPCPVAVIRFDRNPAGRVVVGIDSSGSEGALGDATLLARATGVALMIIHVVRPREIPAGSAGCSLEVAHRLLEAAAASAQAAAPGLQVSQDLVQDASVPRALLNAARGASLIVVGSRGHGLVKASLGSIAHAVLHHATGPVLFSRQRPGT